ncbi:hypothetical protein BCR43DRAFT_563402 [Syncephalastrum racemosum]|uniref:U6 small nuclear RNA (adenine-(43)-N(6))-methyltransferase n=1 Tax=Syncephalastrum racemosum TaxID=13706 RepID=A0A1X2HI09_SYNRA|nr:hypothetical protein BCR43DRAFT_563402 [Syncephalastrum racemosum]
MSKRKSDVLDDTISEEGHHSRNIYANKPLDFEILVKEFPALEPFITVHKNRLQFDFLNADGQRALTKALLKRDFGLSVKLPHDRLCPPVPNRLDYILWVEDILHETLPGKKSYKGIDIGVGASCIYPLLGCARNKDWSFLGTETDTVSYKYAQKNVKRNNMDDRIKIKFNNDRTSVLTPEKDTSYDFCMCNPPFYASQQEIDDAADAKELPPYAICTGSASEMITQGGEYSFIETMINQSLDYKDHITWFTSLIGRKKTIKPLLAILKEKGIENYAVRDFCLGKTKRWAIAWSFGSKRLAESAHLRGYQPKTEFETGPLFEASENLEDHLDAILKDLEMPGREGEATVNTWSRAARRG